MPRLPAAFTDSAVAAICSWLDRAGELMTSTGARARMKADLTAKLAAGELATVPLSYIVAMADHGHEPAQDALAEHIATFIDQKRFGELTPGLQDYGKRVLLRRQLPGYSRGHKIIDTWTRDIVIAFVTALAMGHWRLKKKPAAALVAAALKRHGIKPITTRGVLQIFDARGTIGPRLVGFMLADIGGEPVQKSEG
jgi:hypothetical protein